MLTRQRPSSITGPQWFVRTPAVVVVPSARGSPMPTVAPRSEPPSA